MRTLTASEVGVLVVNLSLPIILWKLTRFFPYLFTTYGLLYATLSIITLYILRQYIRGRQCGLLDRMDGKHVLITGANSGIGFTLAKFLLKRGAHVHMACRSPSRGEEAIRRLKELGCPASNMTLYYCDLANLASVRQFIQDFSKEVSSLDILVCNAGLIGPMQYGKTVDGFEVTYQTNYLAHFLITELLLPIMAKNGRIVNISSIMHRFGDSVDHKILNDPKNYVGIMAYNRTKLAQVMMAKELPSELPNGINIISCHPGNVYTSILETGPLAFLEYTWAKLLVAFVLKTEDDGAQTPLFACLAPTVVSGGYYRECRLDKNVNPMVNNAGERQALLYQTRKILGPFM